MSLFSQHVVLSWGRRFQCPCGWDVGLELTKVHADPPLDPFVVLVDVLPVGARVERNVPFPLLGVPGGPLEPSDADHGAEALSVQLAGPLLRETDVAQKRPKWVSACHLWVAIRIQHPRSRSASSAMVQSFQVK